MLSPTADKALTPKTARAEAKEPLCLVDLPHSLLVLVLRWVEALTPPNSGWRCEDVEGLTDVENGRVSWLVATFLGCESLCSALRSAVQDDAVWLGLSRRCHRKLPSAWGGEEEADDDDDEEGEEEEEEVHEPSKWMEANDRYKPTESDHASCRESVLVARCLRAIMAEQLEVGLMAPGGGSFWAAVGMALWTRNPAAAVHIVLTHKTACALGYMLEDDLLRHMELAHRLTIHRTADTSRGVVNKADLELLALMNSMQPGPRRGPTPFRIEANHIGEAFDTPLLTKLCPEEFGLATQAAMIRRCARRAGIAKYTGAFAEAIWTRLLQRTASVLQRCAVAMTTNLPHEMAKHRLIVAPPPRATRFQANNPFGLVEDDNSEEDDEGEGEELTETEDEDESWRVQARAHMPAMHARRDLALLHAQLLCTRAS